MPTRYIHRGADAAVSYTGNHAGIGVDSDDNQLYVNPAGTRRIIATSAPAALAAAATLTAADFGSTFYLDLAGGFAVTLPAPTLGGRFEFVVSTAPTTAYTIVTASSANVLKGSVHSSTGGNADSEQSGGDTFSFVANTAVAGDRAIFSSDGTSWFVTAFVDADGGATITTAS